MPPSEAPAELETLYAARFAGRQGYRNRVWKVLAANFFSRWISPGDVVLDLGCGRGEFINHIAAGRKYGMDLNPAAAAFVHQDVTLLTQDCSAPWPLPDASLDVVFTSNFFEHLPGKQEVKAALREAFRSLRPGGLLIALGPNIRVVGGRYWDFFDHHTMLTDRSLAEAMNVVGFRTESTARFLPYTMSHGFRPPVWTLRLYLRLPFVWRLFGEQFLILGRKPTLPSAAVGR